MKIALFLTLLILSFSRGITFQELQQELRKQLVSPLVSLNFIYDGATQNGPLFQQLIEEIAKNKQGFFNLISIDCDTDDEQIVQKFPYCSSDIRSKLPALFYTEPLLNPTGDSEPKNHVYAGNLQEKALYEFAIPLMKLYSVNLKKMSDWSNFKEKYPETPLVLYFTDKDKISPFYKALTANFRNTIAFGHIFKNSSICQQLGVTSFPTLLLNGVTKIQMTSNLKEQIEILKEYEGPSTQIVIEEMTDQPDALDEETLQEKIYENPQHILVHIPGTNGQPHNEWKKCKQSFKKMFNYFESETLASKLGVKHQPAIIYFPKSLAQKDIKKTIFYPSDNFRTIYDEISGLIEDFTVPVSDDQQMQQLTSLHLREGKLITVLFHKEEISLSYRVLSNDERFKEEMSFIRMKNPPHEVLEKFQITKLPALFIITIAKESEEELEAAKKGKKKDDEKKEMQLQLAQFTGRFNYDELEGYLKYFLTKPDESQEKKREVLEFDSKKKFDGGCLGQNCYLLLLDGSPEKKESNEEFIEVLKKSMNDILQNVGYVDAKCHSELLAKLEIYAEELPVLIYLNHKFEKYSRLIGRIEESSINIFKAKVKTNKGIWRAYQKLNFQKKDCKTEHEKIQKLQTSGPEMTAEEAQILEQIKLEEEKKKQQVKVEDKSSRRRRKKRRPQEEDSQL